MICHVKIVETAMSEPLKQKKRKKLYINPEIQGRILWRCAFFWISYHFLMLHTLLAFEFFAYQIQIMNGGVVVPFTELYSIFLGKYYPIILTAAAILPIFAFDVLKMSHRVVGPLVPFQLAMKQLKNGEHVDSVKIRDTDLLVEFQQDFNEFLAWYNVKNLAQSKSDGTSSTADAHSEEELLTEIETLHREATDQAETTERSFIEKEG